MKYKCKKIVYVYVFFNLWAKKYQVPLGDAVPLKDSFPLKFQKSSPWKIVN